MNILKPKANNDVHKIVSIMKTKLENKEGKQWSLSTEQTKWLQAQIENQIRSSLRSKVNLTPGKIVLSCSIKFTPDGHPVIPQVKDKEVRVAETQKRRKETQAKEKEEALKNKVLHMK